MFFSVPGRDELCRVLNSPRRERWGCPGIVLMVWLLNVIFPGAGLIVRRREWLGLSLAAVFAICGNLVIAALLIAPLAIPRWLTVPAVSLGAASWILAQYLCHRQGRILARTARGLADLLSKARVAMEESDWEGAHDALQSGMALDDENVEVHVGMARHHKRLGEHEAMRTAWRRVLSLDRRKQFLAEAREGLSARGDDL